MALVKKAALGFTIVAFAAVMAIGAVFSMELIFRAVGSKGSLGHRYDAAIFPYQPYVVSTQPRNLQVGKKKHLLDRAFAHTECDDADGVIASFNSRGFRSPEFDNLSPKEENEIRVIITGGSVAESWNIGEDCTLDRNLKRFLTNRFPGKKVRIFNLASAAWKSFQELVAIQLYGLDIKPDVVIAFDGFNDMQHSFSMDIRRPYSGYMAKMAFSDYVRNLHATPSQLLSSVTFIKRLSDLLRPRATGAGSSETAKADFPLTAKEIGPGMMQTRPRFPLDVDGLASRTDFDPYGKDVVRFYRNNLRTMARAVDGVGGKIIFALQPALYLKSPMTEKEKRILKPYLGSVNFVAQAYFRTRKELTALALQEKNAAFIDLSMAFNGRNEHYFGDNVHFTAEGYSIVAERLADALVSILSD